MGIVLEHFSPSLGTGKGNSRLGVFTLGAVLMKMLVLLILVSVKSRKIDPSPTEPRCAKSPIFRFENLTLQSCPEKDQEFCFIYPLFYPYQGLTVYASFSSINVYCSGNESILIPVSATWLERFWSQIPADFQLAAKWSPLDQGQEGKSRNWWKSRKS